ncbi:flagellar transcriptional regulator FlhC [Verminephrobacter eiseniae]|uniref:flagellar transcriptional regulator FlhC n=1 Tax=Verminephrobacter eiseniae TaxID=364317 RepID=UPI00223760DD|nr:flagellar transcriptional regulator FlhC [Verminephrobacter eiseniae]MCW5234651.1 flagellar transcriptional regulator FlhC [Verminephrobacter eiseniae]MCW5262801.1 flagellar transcriptional regulator FlhC [Verminephrobacter eiseniae]MCW5293774.1 flagellar transcriptional regulator FlhC [Verminephrobacter eiseniae]MCW8186008.1 flagellar transcriptional regulator FlhC [Verminephrobacter eiseniae]MCW8221899.1 flagellar transcriptional regulator FlhC [Verminephrobacter eiseniae]
MSTNVAKARVKSVLNESRQIERAAVLIRMGARMQVLESETTLSYERLIRLYKEIAGKSPSKGQLPFSTDWFLTWQENIHSSLFLNIYEYLSKGLDLDAVELLIRAYRLYDEQVTTAAIAPLLSFTRAWRLVKFVDAGMLTRTRCARCGGQFVTELYESRHFICGLCHPPARAGKSRVAGALMLH